MKIRLTTLAAAILAGYTLPSLAQSDPFIEKVLNEHYPGKRPGDRRLSQCDGERRKHA